MDRTTAGHGRTPADAEDRRRTRRRLEALAQAMDSAFVLPGTGFRFGLDSIIGLVPVVGDAVTTAVSAYLVWEARRLGAPGFLVARMAGNVALDGLVGTVPLLGDLFDAGFKANRRNLRLLTEWLDRTFGPETVELTPVRGADGRTAYGDAGRGARRR